MKQNKPLIRYALVWLCVLAAIQNARATNYYWVGGPGNWSDLNHWATMSGGSTLQSIVPSVTDKVIFDAGSGLGTGQAVTLTGAAYCDSMTWSGISGAPVFAKGFNTLEVHGSLQFQPGMLVTGGGLITLMSSRTNESITTGNVTITGGLTVNGSASSSYVLMDSLKLGSGTLTFTQGNLDMSGRYFAGGTFTAAGTSGVLNIANSVIYITTGNSNAWTYTGGQPLTAAHSANSLITIYLNTGSSGYGIMNAKAGDIYNNVIMDGAGVSSTLANGTYNKVIYNKGINAGSYISKITADTLILSPLAVPYNFFSGATNASTVNKYFEANMPSCSGLIQLAATTAGSQATLNFGTGAVVNVTNALIRDMRVQGPSSPYTAASSFDQGNNTGWNFIAPVAHTYYWVGGAGNWNDQSHWALTSNGTAGSGCVPTLLDKVIFDAGSSLGTGQAVTLTGAAYCDSMTWSGISGAPVFAKGNNTLEVHGSLQFQPGMLVTGGGLITLMSSRTNESITTGNVTITGGLTVNGSASTSYVLMDSLKLGGSTLTFTQGNLDMSGRYFTGGAFTAAGTSGVLNIANSVIYINTLNSNAWSYTGGQPLTAAHSANSLITIYLNTGSTGYGVMNAKAGDIYNNVIMDGAGVSSTISNGIYNKVIYVKGHNPGSYISKITADTLILSPLAVPYNFFSGATNASTVNKYFEANMPSCSGLIQLAATTAGSQATLNFGAGAVVNVTNALIRDMRVQGPSSPYTAASSFDQGNNTGWNFIAPVAHTYYWVGGAGSWNDQSHWALTSNGTAGSGCVPTLLDKVIFDAGSGLGTGQTVLLTGAAYCDSMTWSGISGAPVFAKGNNTLEVHGSLQFQPGMLVTGGGLITLMSSRTNESITTGNVTITGGLTVNGSVSTSYVLMDSLKLGGNTLTFTQGNLDMSGRYFTGGAFSAAGTSGVLNIANSVIYINTLNSNAWSYAGGQPLTAAHSANSLITIYLNTGSTGYGIMNAKAGDIYNNVIMDGAGVSSTLSNGTYNKVTYAKGHNFGSYINNITTDTLLFTTAGVSYYFLAGTTSVVNKVWYASGNPCFLNNIQSSAGGTRATVSMPATAANFPGGVYGIDFVRLKDMNAVTGAGRAVMQIGNQSNDQGNNLNWNIIPYAGPAGITGLGADTTLYCNSFPYTLNTVAFQGNPATTYLWDNGTTGTTRVVNTTGQYNVVVTYGGSCVIKDTITLTRVALPTLSIGVISAPPNDTLTLTAAGLIGAPLYVLDSVLPAGTITTPVTQASNVFTIPQTVTTAYFHVLDQATGCTAAAVFSGAPLPLIITAFTAAGDNCHTQLNWTAGHIDAGATFTVERSNDGIQFESIATIPARPTQSSYSYTDADAGLKAGNRYYRLKLSEASGNYAYSTVREVKSCNSSAMADFRLSPNPVTRGGAVTLYYDGPATEARCQVTGMQGNALFSTPAFMIGGTAGSYTLRLEQLVPGTYMITLVSAEGKILGRQKLAIW